MNIEFLKFEKWKILIIIPLILFIAWALTMPEIGPGADCPGNYISIPFGESYCTDDFGGSVYMFLNILSVIGLAIIIYSVLSLIGYLYKLKKER